jgi:hypothetical protein
MLLAQVPGGRVTVTGHADLVGGERAELETGSKRAAAIRGALIEAGVPAASIRTASAGPPVPMPAAGKADAANRRVEVRFEGELLVPGAPGPGRAVRPLAIDLTPRPGLLTPPAVPPFLQPPAPPGPGVGVTGAGATRGMRGTVADRKPEEPTKPGKASDLLKAVAKVPTIETWIDRTKEEHIGRLKGLSTGEKVVLTTTVVSMGLLTGAGISTDPGARKAALDVLDGAELPVPGAPWLKLKAHTKGGGLGAGLQLDLVKVFPGLK